MSNDNAAILQEIMAKAQQGNSKELAEAYVAAWGELPVGVRKDANNPHYGNDYATLEATLSVIKPVFARHGLALLQVPGRIEGDHISIITSLIHKSGQQVQVETHMPLGGKATAQAAGSATTYGRRYVAQAIGGLAPTDDDGEAASQQASKSTPRSKKPGAPAASYADEVEALLTEINDFTGNYDDMERALRPRVEDLGDAKVNEVYVAKRRLLKKGGKA